MAKVLNSATDSIKSRADEVDNQIDVLSKAFLGLTVACARCHDHKFDPIPTADYYALAGVMHSTGMHEAVVDSPARERELIDIRNEILTIGKQIGKSLDHPREVPETRKGDIVFEDFEKSGYDGWTVSGRAFGDRPVGGIASSFSGRAHR